MSLKFHELEYRLSSSAPEGQYAAFVEISLHDTEPDTYVHVTSSVFVSDDPAQPTGALKQLIADRAATILEAALDLLRAHKASELEARMWSLRK